MAGLSCVQWKMDGKARRAGQRPALQGSKVRRSDLHIVGDGLALWDVDLNDIRGTGRIQLFPCVFNHIARECGGNLEKFVQLVIAIDNLGEAAAREVVVDLESW